MAAKPRDHDYLFKLVIIGDSAVGKSNLLLRYADDEFMESFIATIGVDFRFKTVPVRDKRVRMQIWDTAGQDRFRNITNSYYRSANGICLVYDVTNRDSFTHVKSWLAEANKHAPPDFCKMLIGNKTDRPDRQVTRAEGQALADELGMPFAETSAKTADGVDTAFATMAEQLLTTKLASKAEEDRLSKVSLDGAGATGGAGTGGGGSSGGGCKCG